MSDLDAASDDLGLVIEAEAGFDRRERSRRKALRWAGGGALGAIACSFAFGATLFTAFFVLAGLTGLGAVAAFVALVVVSAAGPPRLLPARVLVESGALRVDVPGKASREVSLRDVAQGFQEDPDRVHLVLRNGDALVLRTPRAADRAAILRAAGVSAAERVLRLGLVSVASQVPGGSLFGGIVLSFLGLGVLFSLVVLGVGVRDLGAGLDGTKIGAFAFITAATALLGFGVYAAAAALRRREVVVGTDGVAYRRTLRTEFVPYASLTGVVPDTRGVRLLRKKGKAVLLPTRHFGERPLPLAPPTGPPATPAEAQRRVLLDRIREAMEARPLVDVARVALDRLDRGGRDAATWRSDLANVLSKGSDYRGVRIVAEDLGSVIEDPTASAERRVAAAVALAAHAPPEARRRVRIAVQACADEDLRAALESAAEGEIDAAHLEKAAARSLRES